MRTLLVATAVYGLEGGLERFNRRWQEYLGRVDLSLVNALRDGYNRFYVLEKECAVGSIRLARQGFQPLLPLCPEDLLGLFPLLPVLQLK